MTNELRCPYKLHGIVEGQYLEVRCRSSMCGYAPGVAVLHRFDVATGKLVETLKFRDPRKGSTGHE